VSLNSASYLGKLTHMCLFTSKTLTDHLPPQGNVARCPVRLGRVSFNIMPGILKGSTQFDVAPTCPLALFIFQVSPHASVYIPA